MIRVDDLNTVITLDIARGNNTRALLDQFESCFFAIFHLQGNALQVQHDVDYIFLNPFDGGVFMLYPVDLHFGDRTAGHTGDQDATQRSPQGVAKATLQRFQNHLCMVLIDRVDRDRAGREKVVHGGHRDPSGSPYLEYSSTIRFSLISAGRSIRSGFAL